MRLCACLLLFGLLFLACRSARKTAAPPERVKLSAPVSRPKSAPQPTDEQAGVAYETGERLTTVLERAQAENRPVFVVFEAVWCAPCKAMETEVLAQKPTFDYLNAHFINYKLDFDSPHGRAIAAIYGVQSLPTVLFLDPLGEVLAQKTGMASHTVLTMLGDSALQKMRE